MLEYVERGELMKFPIRHNRCDKEHANEHFIDGIETVLEYAESIPAADVAPVVHGYWIDISDAEWAECSECGNCLFVSEFGGMLAFGMFRKDYRYCPNCGAKMDGGLSKCD